MEGRPPTMGHDKRPDMPGADSKTKQIKKGRSMNIFKVALFMMRKGKSNKSSMQAGAASKGLWRKLLGATRPPLQLEGKKPSVATHPPLKAAAVVPEDEHQHPPLPPPLSAPLSLENFKTTFASSEKCEDLLHPQSSPSCASTASYEESRYASAMNLHELDVCEEDEDEDEECHFDDSAGDSMIDVKAEMFIAQFYEQMRLQNSQTATYQMIRG